MLQCDVRHAQAWTILISLYILAHVPQARPNGTHVPGKWGLWDVLDASTLAGVINIHA